MASKYGIMTVAQLNNRVNYDITDTAANGTTRLYSDEFIEAIISDNELLVFGDLKTTFTTDNIPNNIKYAIYKLCKMDMEWQLYYDGRINEAPKYDTLSFWKEILYPMMEDERTEQMLVEAEMIDDYDPVT